VFNTFLEAESRARVTTVVGFGQDAAGDDGAGLAVLDELQQRLRASVKLVRAREASVLVELLGEGGDFIVVDAVLVPTDKAGDVFVLQPEDLDASGHSSVSSHGVSVAQAIQLSRALSPTDRARITIVAIGIERPRRLAVGLSPHVAEAVHRAALLIEHRLIEDGLSEHSSITEE
jgi:hydrogenase maturation protease